MTISEAIRRRRSVRTYSKEKLTTGHKEQVERILADGRGTPFGSTPRFQLLDLSEMAEEDRGKLGTYGFIRGAEHFIAGIVDIPETAAHEAVRIMTDFGFAFEEIIIELTRLNLGTCWLGGTFKRKELAELLDLKENELIPAVSPVGHPAKRQSLKSKFIRFAAGSKNRKPLDELVFSSAPEQETGGNDDRLEKALENVRLAPSASNKQPWRIVRHNSSGPSGTYHFFLERNKGYGMFGDYIDLQRIDSGIALCHFAVSAEELGIAGTWKEETEIAGKALPEEGRNWEYVISWRCK